MFPLIGMGIASLARGAVGRFAKKAAGKVLRAATGGRLLGSGGGAAIARRVGGFVAGTAGAGAVTTAVTRAVAKRRADIGPSDYEVDAQGRMTRQVRLYRRMNPLNARALRRAIRRLDGAEKTFKKVFRFNHGTAATNVRPKARRAR